MARVLFLDHNLDSLRQYINEATRVLGHTVVAYLKSWDDFVGWVAHHEVSEFDVAIVNISLYPWNGYQIDEGGRSVVRELRKLGFTGRVIFTSSFSVSSFSFNPLEEGDAFLQKQYGPNDLKDALST